MMDDTLPHVGIVICGCGGIISSTLEIEALRQKVEALPSVVWAHSEPFPCSPAGLERLIRAVEEASLERVLIAGCAPRLVQKLFRRAVGSAGLDPGHLEVLDIREGNALPHAGYPGLANQKAETLLRMGVARLVNAASPGMRRALITRQAAIIGSNLAGLTAALVLADKNIPVTVIPGSKDPGTPKRGSREREITTERLVEIAAHPMVRWVENASVSSIKGQPGQYQIELDQAGSLSQVEAGAILIATRSTEQPLGTSHRFDRQKVRTQLEFSGELDEADHSQTPFEAKNVVMVLCDAQAVPDGRCSRLCCQNALRQAVQVKQLNPETAVTVLFRELFLSRTGMDVFRHARDLGVSFYRWQKNRPPILNESEEGASQGIIELIDELTGTSLKLPYDRAVLAEPITPEEQSRRLAAILNLPVDQAGFLLERRYRLRPERLVDDGVFVLGAAHAPADTKESIYQAYLTASRVAKWIEQGEITAEGPVAHVDMTKCTGCGNCAPVCPTAAIEMEAQPDRTLSLSRISELRCFGCGNCVPTCPTRAISLPGWEDETFLAQIEAALDTHQLAAKRDGKQVPMPRVVAMMCEWGADAAFALAGAHKLSYPANVIPIRLNCSARFDPYHVLWALMNGADGVLLGACPSGECHYGQGNRYASERVETLKLLMAEYGIDPRRLRLEYVSGDDGVKLTRVLNEFVMELGSPLKVA